MNAFPELRIPPAVITGLRLLLLVPALIFIIVPFALISPLWKPYLESEVLPHLTGNTVVLNWSERARWPKISLAVWLFTMFAGHREFNPVALVFRPFAPPKVFGFWRVFRDLKHGKPEDVQRVQADLFAEIRRSVD